MERIKKPTTEQKIQVLSALVGRMTLAARMGKQYGGDRNVYRALGYPIGEIDYSEYATRYARQDIAKAVINRPVQYTWKGPILLKEIGKEESEIEKAWLELVKKLNLRNKFVRLDKLSSIGKYGALLMGFDDIADKNGFKKPVKTEGNRKLLYVKPLGQAHARINTFEKNPQNPRYGLPTLYDIEYSESSESTTTQIVQAHYTRVVHVTTELQESEVYGIPVLESVYNRLMDLEKLVGGSAEMFWRGARPGYQARVKDDYTLPPDVQETLQDQFDEFEHNVRRILAIEGVEMETLDMQVADPANHVDVQIQMISAVTGIPKRILTGSERGELSSAQDIMGWYSHVQTRREEHAEVNILRPFVEKCMEYGALPKSDSYIVEWSDLFAASEKDKAQVGLTRAQAVREYTQNPLATSLIAPKAFYKLFLGLNPDEVKELDEMSDDEIMEELKRIAESGGSTGRTGTGAMDGGDTGAAARQPVSRNNGS
jgi:hypothetical protein